MSNEVEMARFLDRILSFFAFVAMLLLIFITLSIGYAIFARFIGIWNPIWIIQFNEYALLWVTFLGSAWLLAKRKHVSVTLLTSRLGEKTNRGLAIVHALLGMLVSGVLCYYTLGTTWSLYSRNIIDVSTVDVPKYLVICVIPFGCFLLFLQFLRNLIQRPKANRA